VIDLLAASEAPAGLPAILQIGLNHYLALAAALFTLGILAMVARRNAIGVLIGIELVLNAANVNLVAFGRYTQAGLQGPVFALFVIMLAAAEAAIALAILLNLFERTGSVSVDEADAIKG
jgi:NADH-quinone oxidoreductase subunit K